MRSNDALSTYLNDHFAGATAGVGLARRTASSHAGTPAEKFLRTLVDQIADDRQTLIRLQKRLGIGRSRIKAAAGWVEEKVTRLKLSQRITGDINVTRLLELETLSLGIAGKVALWQSLEALSGATDLGDIDLVTLVRRAEKQRADLDRYRLDAARVALTD